MGRRAFLWDGGGGRGGAKGVMGRAVGCGLGGRVIEEGRGSGCSR